MASQVQCVAVSFVVRGLAITLLTVVGCGSSDGDGRSRDRANPILTSHHRAGNAGAAGNASNALGGRGSIGTSYTTGTGGGTRAEAGGSSSASSGASGESGHGGQGSAYAGAGGTGRLGTEATAAGAAGHPGFCGGAALHYCNDGNDCTLDSCEPATGCQHVAIADGAACDDHDVCTQGDHCVAGGCIGAVSGKSAAVLGSLDTFGGFEELDTNGSMPSQGLATMLTESLAVFAEPRDPGTLLHLVEIESTDVKLLDSVLTYGTIRYVSGLNHWSPYLATHLVALSGSRVALVASGHDIEIYDVVDSRLVLQAYRYLSQDSVSIVGDAAGLGNRLWLLGTSQLHGFDIASNGTITPLGEAFSPLTTQDQIALSEDKATLYAGGQGGIVRIDVTDPLSPLIDTSPVIARVTERRPYQLEAVGKYLLLQEEVFLGTPGDVRLFRTSDWQEVARFPSSSVTDSAYTAPTGATFVDGGLLLQRIQNANARPSKLVAELYTLDDQGVHLKDQFVYRDLAAIDNRLLWQPLPPVARGTTVIVGPTRRVLTTRGGVIKELKGLAQGSPMRVISAGPGQVLAFSSESTHYVDISDPHAPRIRAGGLLGQDATNLIRMSLPNTSRDEVSLLDVESRFWDLHSRWQRSGGKVSQFTLKGDSAPEAVGNFTLPGGDAHAASGDLLLRVTAVENGTWQLDTFELPRVPRQGETLLPSETQTLAASTGAVTGTMVKVFADVASQNLILITKPLSGPTILDWFTRDSGAWKMTGTVAYPEGVRRDVTLRGNTAVVAGPESDFGGEGERIDVVRREAGQIHVHAMRELAPSDLLTDAQLLDIDGDKVYVTMSERSADNSVSKVVISALSLDTLDTVATYDTPQFPSSMTVVDGHLVFGAKTHLLVADPECDFSARQ